MIKVRFPTKADLRQQVLLIIATLHSLFALVALLDPDRVAVMMGEFPIGVNGYSQFYAVYVGVRLFTAGLATWAARPGQTPLLGDITAALILAQPLGRLVAAIAIGLPQGDLLIISVVELCAGGLILALRPAPRSS